MESCNKKSKPIEHDCCIGGWAYVQHHGFIMCASHEIEAVKNGKPPNHKKEYYEHRTGFDEIFCEVK